MCTFQPIIMISDHYRRSVLCAEHTHALSDSHHIDEVTAEWRAPFPFLKVYCIKMSGPSPNRESLFVDSNLSPGPYYISPERLMNFIIRVSINLFRLLLRLTRYLHTFEEFNTAFHF